MTATKNSPLNGTPTETPHILLTGATGFVGGWLAKRLIADGYTVTALVRPQSDFTDLKNLGVQLKYGDVTNYGSLVAALDGINAVFHLAGVVGYTPKMHSAMWRVNVFGTRNVLKACREKGVRKLLHMSSVVAIGSSFTPKALNETDSYNLQGLNLGYFDTKHAAENLVLEAVQAGDIEAVIVNPSTIYGATDAKKSSRKIQVKVARGEFPFYTSGGVNVIDIADLIDGIMLAWEKGQIGERYILAGENISIKELFQTIALEAGQEAPRIYLPNALLYFIGFVGDILHKLGLKAPINSENAKTATLFHWFDGTKAKDELGFQPTNAKAAIAKSVNWMKDNHYLDR